MVGKISEKIKFKLGMEWWKNFLMKKKIHEQKMNDFFEI